MDNETINRTPGGVPSRVTTRLNDEERALLEQLMEDTGINNPSTALKACLKDYRWVVRQRFAPRPSGDPEELKKLRREVERLRAQVERLGVNVNQISKAVNTGYPLNVPAIEEARALLVHIRFDIKDTLGAVSSHFSYQH